MEYTKKVFQSGDVLMASDMNKIGDDIESFYKESFINVGDRITGTYYASGYIVSSSTTNTIYITLQTKPVAKDVSSVTINSITSLRVYANNGIKELKNSINSKIASIVSGRTIRLSITTSEQFTNNAVCYADLNIDLTFR